MDNVRASILMVGAMALFSLQDMLIKRASVTLPVGQILIMIGAGGFVVLALLARAQGARLIDPALWSRAVLLRNAGELVGTIGLVTALALIPISTASVILQASPLVVTLGAALFLGETVGWRRWSAIAVGLAGVVLILRPGMAGFQVETLWAVLGVIGLSLRDLATRRLPPRLTTVQISAWAFATVVVAGALTLGLGGAPSMPGGRVTAELALALVFGLFGYAAITMSIRGGDLSVVAPFRYSRIVFALILGAVFFAERPDALTLAGAGLIVGSGLYTLAREARKRAARPSPAPGAAL